MIDIFAFLLMELFTICFLPWQILVAIASASPSNGRVNETRTQLNTPVTSNHTDVNEVASHTGVTTPRRRMTYDTSPSLREKKRTFSFTSLQSHFNELVDRQEVCHKCDIVLPFFRRKRMCQSCGNICCKKCSMKIKKSFLGVTSPRTSKELVNVCIPCNQRLTSS
ncbi:hypothetical protein LOD99_2587 [Oopsacas minuta]|uniref:FYVE-type domain-containing protein n=1 Tax=Oopsacas minuta TaxID=111878 RepID=A0AAV7K0G9_9METZ|nr:hypothetical protein LOD99_2587 [Oopsacas minuta]